VDFCGMGSEDNRRAKFYSITNRIGRKQLSTEAANWERISGVIGRVLQIAERG
jgi:PadR family transcriptional regulator PadR